MITGGSGSFAHWRSFGSLTLVEGPWSGSYSLQYVGSAEDINASPGDIGDHSPSVAYHNAQVEYAFSPSFDLAFRSEEHTSELQSLMRISYAVFCLKKQKTTTSYKHHVTIHI